MRQFYIFSILLFLGSFSLNAQKSSGPVRVMSYNIRLDHAGDLENNWHFRKEAMVKFIEREEPDFFCIQEGLNNQVCYLDSALVDYHFIGVGRDDGKESGEYMAIFFRTRKWTCLDSNTIWLSSTPGIPSRGWDAACNRVCTYARFLDNNDFKIELLNTHLDHMGQQARENSLIILDSLIRTIPYSMPLILTGDFNFDPTDPLYLQMCTVLTDSHSFAVGEDLEKGTFNAFEQKENYKRRIDYIFVNHQWTVDDYKVKMPKTEKGLHVSDHFPVIVSLNPKS